MYFTLLISDYWFQTKEWIVNGPQCSFFSKGFSIRDEESSEWCPGKLMVIDKRGHS